MHMLCQYGFGFDFMGLEIMDAVKRTVFAWRTVLI